MDKRIEIQNSDELYKTIADLKNQDECMRFLTDLCTPAELSAMADRWKAARLLNKGLSYREVYAKSGVSTATVTRVARCLTLGAGGYRMALDRLKNKKKEV